MRARLADPRPESSELQTEGPTPSRLWGDQWLRVSEKVLKGLNLDLANRVAALDALTTTLEAGSAASDPSLVRSLRQETSRLASLLQLFHLMPAEPFVTTEPVRLQEIIPHVIDLHRHHTDLRAIAVSLTSAPHMAPVLVRPSALLRCLLVLLESAAGNALRAGSPSAVDVTCGSDASKVFVRIEGPAPTGTLLFTGDGSLVHAVRTALAHGHGTADAEMRGTAVSPRILYEVVLPALGVRGPDSDSAL